MDIRFTRTLLASREQRLALPTMDYPRWVEIDKGRHIGYCRGMTVQSWYVRLRLKKRKYRQYRLGAADDMLPADGVEVLTFSQALAAATAWCDDHRDIEMSPTRAYECEDRFPELPDAPPYTVGHAIVDFMKWYEGSRRGFPTIYYSCRAHILPELGDIPLQELQSRTIRLWLDRLADTPARIRSGRSGKINFRPYSPDPETKRQRCNTVNRVLRILKTALNRAYEYGHVDDPSPWRRIQPYRGVNHPRTKYLELDQCRELVAACSPALGKLVRAALLTGCRIGELREMRVGDYMAERQRIFVADGKGGKQRHVSLSREGAAFFSELNVGRGPEEHLLVRDDGTPWTTYTHLRQFHNACVKVGIDPPVNFHALRHTYATQLAMAGIPFEVLAKQLGHKDTRMVQRHYAHLGNSYVDQIIDKQMPLIF